MKDRTIFQQCPVYESDHFLLRSIELGDAEDLLHCYSDPSSVRMMNGDNCGTDFHLRTLDEMNDLIQGWLDGYRRRIIVRFSIIDTQSRKAIGTIEMHEKMKDVGILRLDLCSAYETQNYILELLGLATDGFYDTFGVQKILIKAIPDAAERISALRVYGFVPVEHHAMRPFGDYYIHDRC